MQGGQRRLFCRAKGAAGIAAICYVMPQASALQPAPACRLLYAQLSGVVDMFAVGG